MKTEEILIYDAISKQLQQHAVIAYPTEAVFGLGCDPDDQKAVNNLLALKQRPWQKGLILVAATYQQLSTYIDETQLPAFRLQQILSTWPGAVTWVMPAKKSVPRWLTGEFNTLAVRVSNHPTVVKICLTYGKPIVSTSANLSGLSPCKTDQDVVEQFGNSVILVKGQVGKSVNPTMIRDALTGKVVRQG